MLFRALIAAALLGFLWWGLRWFAQAPPERVSRLLKTLGLAALVLAGIWLTLTGKLEGLIAIAAGLAPWGFRAMRLHTLWSMLRGPRPASSGPSPTTGRMTRDEAYAVLGLAPGASKQAIKEAHRRLMRVNHPDHGGSTWVAARLNQARDVLLA